MNKSMRILAIVLSLVMMIGLMSACSGSKQSGNDTPSTSTASPAPSTTQEAEEKQEDKKPVSIRFMWWGGDDRHNRTIEVINLYQKSNPHVTIEAEYGGWDGYQDKLTTQLASGTAPDLMQVSFAWVANLQKKGGFFADLSKYPQLIDLSMFPSNLIEGFSKVDDAIVAVPTGVSAYAFLVNKDTLAKAGVSLGQKWTWDGYLEAAKKVHALGEDYYLSVDNTPNVLFEKYLRPYVMGKTGNVWINDDYTMGFTREHLAEAFSYIKALNDAEAWPPVSEVVSSTTLDQRPEWLEGKIASTLGQWVSSITPSASAIGDAADVEICPVRADAVDTAIASQPSQQFCVNAKSENIEETIKFLNYLFTDEEALTILADCRGVPSSTKGREVAETKNLVNPLVAKCLDLALENSTKIPYSHISDDSELFTAGQDVIEMLLFGKLTPEQAADELISRYNVRLAEMKEAAN
jgi:oligogalacturonide transport system substrate-binding protein